MTTNPIRDAIEQRRTAATMARLRKTMVAVTADEADAIADLLEAIDDIDLPDVLDAREIDPDELRRIQSAAAALATAITRAGES